MVPPACYGMERVVVGVECRTGQDFVQLSYRSAPGGPVQFEGQCQAALADYQA